MMFAAKDMVEFAHRRTPNIKLGFRRRIVGEVEGMEVRPWHQCFCPGFYARQFAVDSEGVILKTDVFDIGASSQTSSKSRDSVHPDPILYHPNLDKCPMFSESFGPFGCRAILQAITTTNNTLTTFFLQPYSTWLTQLRERWQWPDRYYLISKKIWTLRFCVRKGIIRSTDRRPKALSLRLISTRDGLSFLSASQIADSACENSKISPKISAKSEIRWHCFKSGSKEMFIRVFRTLKTWVFQQEPCDASAPIVCFPLDGSPQVEWHQFPSGKIRYRFVYRISIPFREEVC